MSSKIENIVSDKNEKIKNLLSRKEDLFMFEGEKLTADILKKGFKPDLMIISEDHHHILINSIPEETVVWIVSGKVMKKISSLSSIPSVIAIFSELPQRRDLFGSEIIFALDNVQDPGNMGSLFRCAAAFGIVSIALTGDCVRLTNAKFLRTAQDSIFYMGVERFNSLADLLTEAVSKKYNIYLTSSHHQDNQIPFKDIKLPSVIVIGNEGKGIEKKLLGEYRTISIKQTGLVESLNAGVSGCILMNLLSEKFELIKS